MVTWWSQSLDQPRVCAVTSAVPPLTCRRFSAEPIPIINQYVPDRVFITEQILWVNCSFKTGGCQPSGHASPTSWWIKASIHQLFFISCSFLLASVRYANRKLQLTERTGCN